MNTKEIIESILNAEQHLSIAKGPSMDIYEKPLENINLLMNVYKKAKNNKIKKTIIGTVSNFDSNQYFYLNFEFLIRIREFDIAFESLERILSKIKNNQIWHYEYYRIFNYCIGRLNFLIDYEELNPKEIDLLRFYTLDSEKFIRHTRSLRIPHGGGTEVSFNKNLRTKIIEKLDLKKLDIVKNLYSLEIFKEDIDKLSKEIKKVGLGDEVALSFRELEKKYSEAVNKVNFAMFGGHIRTTLSELVKKIAKKVESRSRNKISGKEDKDYRNYLEKQRIINEGLGRMIKGLYSFLSSKVNHQIITEQEYYKRGLNIASQIGLLLVREYEATLPVRKTIPT